MKFDITSLINPKIKQVIKLRRRRYRDKEGLFLIEGYRELTRALEQVELKSLFYCSSFFQPGVRDLIGRIGKKVEVFSCSREVFYKISSREHPDGFLAIGVKWEKRLSDLEKALPQAPLIVVTEGIEKPGNLGAILRSCDGAKVDGIIACDPSTDIFNPNVVRASMGILFIQLVVKATTLETIEFLKQKKIKIAVATPHAKDEFTAQDLSLPIAIVVGAEQYGLTEKWLDSSDIQIKIPMLGVGDSLNVAAATTLLIYEAIRQKHSPIFR